MDAILYNISCDKLLVDKTEHLESLPTHKKRTLSDCYLVNDTSITNPQFSIILPYDDMFDIPWNCIYNYIVIPELGRSYFINDIQFRKNKILVLDCHVDVLHSFHGIIKESEQLVKRQENHCTYKLVDNEYTIKSSRSLKVKEFGVDVIEPNEYFVITTSGHKIITE